MIGSHVKWKGQWNGLLGKWADSTDYPVGPFVLPGLQGYYDTSDTSSLVYDSAGRVSLFMDKSGNSGVNCLVLNGVAGNYASFTALAAPGTGDFSVSASISASVLATFSAFVASNSNGGCLRVNTSNQLEFFKVASATIGNSTGTITAANRNFIVGYTRSGTTGTYYIDGIAAGTQSDSNDYTVGFGEIGSRSLGTANPFTGLIRWARVYNVALTAPQMLADAGGTAQTGCIENVLFSSAAKLATSVTAAIGNNVTINTSGAFGARICGERDLYQGTVANQPVYCPWNGTNYGYLNGVAGNYFSTPDAAALDIAGDIEVIALVAASDYTPSSTQDIASKMGAAGNRSWRFYLATTTGNLVFETSNDGTTLVTNTSSVAPTLTDGTWYWLRATLDVDNGAGGRTANFYFAPYQNTVPTVWTQIGSSVTTAGTTSIFNSTAPLEVGSRGAGLVEIFAGNVSRFLCYDGIGGTLVADFDASRYVSGPTFVASTGETWTVNGGAHIVTRTGLYFDGSNDYLKSAPFAQAQPATRCLVAEQVTWTLNDIIMDGNSISDQYIYQSSITPGFRQLAFATISSPNTDWAVKTAACATVVTAGASSSTRVNRLAPVNSATGTAAANGVALGASANGGACSNIFVSEVAIYNTALSTASQDALALYEGRKWGFTV